MSLSDKALMRFREKIRIDDATNCHIWTGHVGQNGYGQFWDGSKVRGAHVVGYEISKGLLPEGTEPDHKCRNRACVNGHHMDAVTRRENLLRGNTIPAKKAGQTHCEQGHAFTPENTYHTKNGRSCRICRKNANAKWAASNRERRRELDRQSYARRS